VSHPHHPNPAALSAGQKLTPQRRPARRHFAALAYGSLRKKPAASNPQLAYFSIGINGSLFDRP
jgi:hypothetical protein